MGSNDRCSSDWPDVHAGDRVRVVLEGEAGRIDERSRSFSVGGNFAVSNRVYRGASQVVSVEKLARVWKVGDEVACKRELDKLPAGTVVQGFPGSLLKRSAGDWLYSHSVPGDHPAWDVRDLGVTRRAVLYLPGA